MSNNQHKGIKHKCRTRRHHQRHRQQKPIASLPPSHSLSLKQIRRIRTVGILNLYQALRETARTYQQQISPLLVRPGRLERADNGSAYQL